MLWILGVKIRAKGVVIRLDKELRRDLLRKLMGTYKAAIEGTRCSVVAPHTHAQFVTPLHQSHLPIPLLSVVHLREQRILHLRERHGLERDTRF